MNANELIGLYKQAYRSRIFEECVVQIWNDGLITGEMHTGIGEEAINVGVVSQLVDGDALALDHRGTSPALIRGIDPKLLLLEFMGLPQGLCAGNGGHMHILSKSHLLASSGIVGASGPTATGFALASQFIRPERIAVAFFGEGAMNQGMLMESMNLASVMKLPVLFICKDSGMAITTVSSTVTAGKLTDRARGFDIPSSEINGSDITAVYEAANKAISRARSGDGPTFIHASCRRPQGHFLGDPLLRIVNDPIRELAQISGPLMAATTKVSGASMKERLASVKDVLSLLRKTAGERSNEEADPLFMLRKKLQHRSADTDTIEAEINLEMNDVVEEVLKIYSKNASE